MASFMPARARVTLTAAAVGVVAAAHSAQDRSHDARSVAAAASSSAIESAHMVPLFPSASDALGRQGFARVIHHGDESGEVTIHAFDDAGTSHGPLTLTIGAGETIHFNSADLENGNTGKGLAGKTGPGEGDWRLELDSGLDIEVLSYIRTGDGFLTAMHDTAPEGDDGHRVAIFNPGSNTDQQSLLRLVNRGDADASVTITGTDDKGSSPGEGATAVLAAHSSVTYTAAELESGNADGLTGSIGDGSGKWRLTVRSEQDIVAMSLLSSPTGHLTNLSTAPDNETGGTHSVPLFPSASDENGRQGFLRVVNHADESGEVTIAAFDDTDRKYESLTLAIGANETKHFNSDDLELGNAGKGLTGSTGAGEGDWRLELTSDLDIEVLAYIRTSDGFLTAMHDSVPNARGRHRIATFNPGSNTRQRSLLHLVNAAGEPAEVTVRGIDDRGASPGSEIRATLPARASETWSAAQLEAGGDRFTGALGDGSGKWQLLVDSDRPIAAMSLLSSTTGHLTNLSSAPGRDFAPPRLLSPGAIGMEWRLWETEVAHDQLGVRFAADFEGDGDQDVVITSYAADASTPGSGVILLNNGDFTFTVAKGDRPEGIHPGVLMADFDGDGMNDFFVIDSGWDEVPFPGWGNQLLLWTADGYLDASDRMPADPNGYTHGAASGDVDGDGDVDLLVANSFEETISGEWVYGPYFLLNDGDANFVLDTERLPDSMKTQHRPWAVKLVDLDGDGRDDLVAGATSEDEVAGQSFVYWGSDDGRYHDGKVTVLPKAGFYDAFGTAEVVSIGICDCDGNGSPDLLLGGYHSDTTLNTRGVQLLVNDGGRAFFDETRYRLGDRAWSPTEGWQAQHLCFDFNGDGTVDIVPQHYRGWVEGDPNVMAWLNDGAGRYVPLRTTEFDDEDNGSALWHFASGVIVRVGAEFKAVYFGGDDATHLTAKAAFVVESAEITLVPVRSRAGG